MSDLPPPPPSYGGPVFGPPDGEPEFTSWGSRAGAFLIDFVVLLVASFVILMVVRVLAASDGVAVAIGVAVSGAYFIMQEGAAGYTLGKRALGAKIAGDDGTTITYGTAALRWVVKYLVPQGAGFVVGPAILIWILLDYLWPLWDPKRQTLHDKAARTIVVQT